MSSKRHSLNQHIKGKGSSALSCCLRGKGFYSSKQFHKHKEICKGNTDDILSSVGVDAFKTMGTVDDEFTMEILPKITIPPNSAFYTLG